MKASRKNSSHQCGILAFIGLVAIAWIKLGSADKLATTGTHEMECSALSHCAGNLKLGYPVGDGLVFTPIMDDFF